MSSLRYAPTWLLEFMLRWWSPTHRHYMAALEELHRRSVADLVEHAADDVEAHAVTSLDGWH